MHLAPAAHAAVSTAAMSRYRDIDLAARVAGASPHQLVAMLFDGLAASLGGAAAALTARQPVQRIRTVTKSLAILDALEASLDFGSGGKVARTFATLYGELRALVVAGNAEVRPELFAAAADRVAMLSDAWRSIAPGAR